MLTTIIAGAFVLGVVVLVHEFGHFIVAKKSGVFVKTFSIGFGRKILKRRIGDTVYALSLLPFGGYVKFAGESMYYDENEPPDEYEGAGDESGEVPDSAIPRERYYTMQPARVRAAILFAGPLMNYVAAVLIYIGVVIVTGLQMTPSTTVGAVTVGGAADSSGLRPGDKIVDVDGQPVKYWEDITAAIVADPHGVRHFEVIRGNRRRTVDFRAKASKAGIDIGFEADIPPVIGRVQRSRPAWRAGIRQGARIEAIDDTTVTSYSDIRRMIHARPEKPVYVRWSFDGVAHGDTVVPEAREVLAGTGSNQTETVGLIGVGPEYVKRYENPLRAVRDGFSTTNRIIVQIVGYLGKLVTGKMNVKTLGGPIMITKMAGDVADWGFDYLLLFLAFFNVNLCVFNLVPMVPFDGGHIAIIVVETITRRPLGRKTREWMMQAGFVVVILLMAFVVMLDLTRCSGGSMG